MSKIELIDLLIDLLRRQTVQNWLVFAWASRLGTFLFLRILNDGQDKRFNKEQIQSSSRDLTDIAQYTVKVGIQIVKSALHINCTDTKGLIKTLWRVMNHDH